MHHIEWQPPEPRTGFLGAWDKFVGPGATSSEEWLQLGGGLLLMGILSAAMIARGEALAWSTLQWAVALLLAFDLVGGIITNATSAAKRWYHRAGQDGLAAHLPFIAVHGLHLLLVSAVFRKMDWGFFAATYAYLLLAAVLLIRVPLYLQRPLSMLVFCGGCLLGMYAFTPTAGLEWVLPFFYLKLLVSHLVTEAPFASEPQS